MTYAPPGEHQSWLFLKVPLSTLPNVICGKPTSTKHNSLYWIYGAKPRHNYKGGQ